ncbi:AraC family transcriptional regulator [Pseudarthrobacter sp. B4EP4b]|uniref:AraC family transcriptional regulator n=1 Tax=Pseudarthrobacter sp. B4EP4b TaxID=2590664 RepID=UPI00114E5BE2|nr:AraC family transcriptional regulator [Pseudarthrobacter sp. B4EP4b]
MSPVHSVTTYSDPLEAANLIASVYFPHELRVVGQPQDFGLRLRATGLGPVTVGVLGWGADVAVDSTYPGSFAFNIPLSGRIESSHDGRRIKSVNGHATVCSPDRPARITLWSADCVGIALKIDREYMVRKIRQLTGTDDEILLPDQLDLSGPRWRGWVNLLRALPGQDSGEEDLLGGLDVSTQLSGAITDSLIAGLTSDSPSQNSAAAARPRHVKRVLEAVHADPARGWTLSDLAELAGVSGRRLQQSFRTTLGLSPTEYLRDLRLTLVHRDLLECTGGASVRDIAAKWGFVHAGRFSLLYKQKYGRLPSSMLNLE